MDETRLTIVADESEAELLCGLLRANGIVCAHRQSNVAAGASDGLTLAWGAREVFVREQDLERARELAQV